MFKPLNKFVYIQPITERKSNSGIILTKEDDYFAGEGIVIAVGPDVIKVKDGDHAIFNAHFAFRLDIDGKKMILLDEKDIFGVKVNESIL